MVDLVAHLQLRCLTSISVQKKFDLLEIIKITSNKSGYSLNGVRPHNYIIANKLLKTFRFKKCIMTT